MTVIIVGDQQQTTHLEITDSGHGHEAEDIVDIGTLDITDGKLIIWIPKPSRSRREYN